MKSLEKAHLGENKQSCDKCGCIGGVGEFASIYFGDKGQKIDLCVKCFDREVVRKRD